MKNIMDYNKVNTFEDVFEIADGSLRKAYDQFELYVNSGRPLIYIQHFDFAVVDAMVTRIENRYPAKIEVLEYVCGIGAVLFNKSKEFDESTPKTIKDFLFKYVKTISLWDDEYECNKILVLKNVHNELEDYDVQSLLRQIASASMHEFNEGKRSIFVIIVSSDLFVPSSLERLIAFIKLEPPKEKEIKKHLENFFEHLSTKAHEISRYDSKEAYEKIASKLRGLSMVEIDQVLALVLTDNLDLWSKEAEDAIQRERRQIIQKSGLLRLVDSELETHEVGGLKKLQEYLENKAKIYEHILDAKNNKIDIPKGVLIVGMPGCGKTLTAKVASSKFRAPLICLDIGRLMGKYVGESENNMRHALALVESVAPCVLWIDELEKAFSGVTFKSSAGGSEVSTRLFGYFLTWMQEKTDAVYVIATANRISQLPPELLRRGRFDEIFCVNLPTKKERKEIFKVHLKRHGEKYLTFTKEENEEAFWEDILRKEFCGADIAAVVGNSFQEEFLKDFSISNNLSVSSENENVEVDIGQKELHEELKKQASSMTPLQDSLKDVIEENIRLLKQYKFRSASDDDISKI